MARDVEILIDICEELKYFALTLPDTHAEFPHNGHTLKVNKKSFIEFKRTARPSGGVSIKANLPNSYHRVLSLPYARPANSRSDSRWVEVRFASATELPQRDYLADWIVESYRAAAPGKLSKYLAN